MSWITDRMSLKDNQTKVRRIDLNKFTLGTVRGSKFQYIIIRNSYKINLNCYNDFFYNFLISSPWRVFYIIQFHFHDLNPTFVDYLSHYLSACLIGHHFWPSMSWDSQCSTVQGSFLHKCGQKSSSSAFNTVAAALFQIFPSSYSFSMFVMLALSSGVSWKVTLSDRICIRSALGLSEEIFLLGTPFPTFPLEYYFGGL